MVSADVIRQHGGEPVSLDKAFTGYLPRFNAGVHA